MVQESKPRFLVVDDEPVIVDFVASIVLPAAGSVRKAYDGEEAVSVAREFRPDCVVTGIIMPRMRGFEEAGIILKFLPACKFVFMSGSAHEPAIRAEYEQLGPDIGPLMAKPFSRRDLLNALARVGFPDVGER
jgi:CheY-like chemotaxis protein